MVGQRSGQLVNQIHGCGEECLDAMLTRMITESQTNMGFPGSRRTHEDGVLFLLDEMEIKEAKDMRLIDRFWEREIEGIQGFDDREIGLSETGFNAALLPGCDFMRG